MGVYNFVIEIDGVDTKDRGQYYGKFINGDFDDGVFISGNVTYVGKIKGSIKDGFGTLYINDGPTLIGDWKNDKMHANGRIIFQVG
tara:strand:+ start:70 stop:327 length:258 start_codon:yes stop_codon:yes gene_type:complete